MDPRLQRWDGIFHHRFVDLPHRGFTHVVAGSAEVLYGTLTGATSFWQAFAGFFLPTLAGNIFGGTVLFSVLSYAQVREEISANKGGMR